MGEQVIHERIQLVLGRIIYLLVYLFTFRSYRQIFRIQIKEITKVYKAIRKEIDQRFEKIEREIMCTSVKICCCCNQNQKSQWISVKHSLPSTTQWVLASSTTAGYEHTEGDVLILWFVDDYFSHKRTFLWIDPIKREYASFPRIVTHWMPLPPAPSTEEMK